MKVTVFCSAGEGDPVKASMPLHLGLNGSAENGDEVNFILGGDATELIVGNRFERIEGLGLPPLRELVGKLREKEIPVFV